MLEVNEDDTSAKPTVQDDDHVEQCENKTKDGEEDGEPNHEETQEDANEDEDEESVEEEDQKHQDETQEEIEIKKNIETKRDATECEEVSKVTDVQDKSVEKENEMQQATEAKLHAGDEVQDAAKDGENVKPKKSIEKEEVSDEKKIAESISVDQVREVLSSYFDMDALSPENRADYLLIMQKISNSRAQDCGDFVTAEWKKIWDPVSSFLKGSEQVMLESWVAKEFPQILHTFLSEYEKNHWQFEPELGPECIESLTLRAQAKELVKRVRQHHVHSITEDVQVAFDAVLALVPTFMQDTITGSMRESFLQKEYFNIVRHVVDLEMLTTGSFSFDPMVPVDTLKTEALRRLAISIVSEVREEHVELIGNAVETQYKIMLSELPDFVRGLTTDGTKAAWLNENYYAIVAKVISGTLAPDAPAPSTPHEVASRKRDFSAVSMLESPSPRLVRPRQGGASDALPEATYITTGAVHLTSPSNQEYKMQAYLIYVPEGPRYVNGKRSQDGGETEKVPIATCIIVDRDGPLHLDLWRNETESLLPDLQSQYSQSSQGGGGPTLLELQNVQIRNENRKAFPIMRNIVAGESTVIQILTIGTQASVTQMALSRPKEEIFTRDLNRLQIQPPFVVNVSGIIGSSEDERTTQNGQTMRKFVLHGTTGKYVECLALGRHTSNRCIADGNEIVIYFAQGKSSSSANQNDSLWIFDDGHMVTLRQGVKIPNSRTAVDFRI